MRSNRIGGASSEIPNTAPFPASPKTALCWEFLRFPPRLAPLDSRRRGTGERHHRSVSGFAENCAMLGISSLSAATRSAGLAAEGDGGATPPLRFRLAAKTALWWEFLRSRWRLCRLTDTASPLRGLRFPLRLASLDSRRRGTGDAEWSARKTSLTTDSRNA